MYYVPCVAQVLLKVVAAALEAVVVELNSAAAGTSRLRPCASGTAYHHKVVCTHPALFSKDILNKAKTHDAWKPSSSMHFQDGRIDVLTDGERIRRLHTPKLDRRGNRHRIPRRRRAVIPCIPSRPSASHFQFPNATKRGVDWEQRENHAQFITTNAYRFQSTLDLLRVAYAPTRSAHPRLPCTDTPILSPHGPPKSFGTMAFEACASA